MQKLKMDDNKENSELPSLPLVTLHPFEHMLSGLSRSEIHHLTSTENSHSSCSRHPTLKASIKILSCVIAHPRV
jgi:hypothetical protein